jgi:fructosamine-3-kinase
MVNRADIEAIGKDISLAIGRDIKIKYPPSLGYSGGGGASTGILTCEDSSTTFFAKVGGMHSYDMLKAEYAGIRDIYDTKTIRVPKPICYGIHDSTSYAIFEKLAFGGRSNDREYARKLCLMHQCCSPNGMFGYHINNTIGATFQPNVCTPTWAEFWDTHRLGHMLTLAKRDGAVFSYEQEVRAKVKEILQKHDCKPSLVHGDLWSGNQGCLTDGEPVIFDPAVYVST